MARIDTFLAQLIAHEADALLVESGDNIYLVKAAQRAPLMQVRPGAITNAHVVSLLSEIAPPQARAFLEGGEPVAWHYPWGTCTIHVEVAFLADGRCVARVTDAGSREVAAAGGAVVDDDEPAQARPAIERYLRFALERGASDVHLTSGRVPALRIDGELQQHRELGVLDPYGLQKMIEEIMPAAACDELERTHDADFAYELDGARFRCNVFRDVGGVGGVFRSFARRVRTADELQLPREIVELASLKQGLVVVTGPNGCGKSSTLAALVDVINSTRSEHIVTIEDPVEVVHAPKRALINQRQVGEHTGSFARALRAAAREDPDVVVVGAVPDLETLSCAIDMAERGCLVFIALHAPTTAAAVDRLIDPFPLERQHQIRHVLADVLKGVVAHSMCKRIDGGRVVAHEILTFTPATSAALREGQPPSPARALDDTLRDLVLAGIVDVDEAASRAIDKLGFAEPLRAIA